MFIKCLNSNLGINHKAVVGHYFSGCQVEVKIYTVLKEESGRESCWALSAAPSSHLEIIIYGADILWTDTRGQVSPLRGRTHLRDVKCEVHIAMSAGMCDGWARSSSKCNNGL